MNGNLNIVILARKMIKVAKYSCSLNSSKQSEYVIRALKQDYWYHVQDRISFKLLYSYLKF